MRARAVACAIDGHGPGTSGPVGAEAQTPGGRPWLWELVSFPHHLEVAGVSFSEWATFVEQMCRT